MPVLNITRPDPCKLIPVPNVKVEAPAAPELALTVSPPEAVGDEITLFNVKLPKFVIVEVPVLLARLNVTLPNPVPVAFIPPVDVANEPEPVVPLFTVYVRGPLLAQPVTEPTAVPVEVLMKVRAPELVSVNVNVLIG